MHLRANRDAGLLVRDFLFAQHARSLSGAELPSYPISDLSGLIDSLIRVTEDIQAGKHMPDYSYATHWVVMRAMSRGCHIGPSPEEKMTRTCQDIAKLCGECGFDELVLEDIQPLMHKLHELYQRMPAPDELGTLGHTTLGTCRYYIQHAQGMKGQKRRSAMARLQALAMTCDRATTVADQRQAIGALGDALKSELRHYKEPSKLNEIIELFWSWTTQYLLDDPVMPLTMQRIIIVHPRE